MKLFGNNSKSFINVKGEKMFKKIVAFSLILVMMLSVLPVAKTEAAFNKASYKY